MREIKFLTLLLGVVCMIAFNATTYAAISYTNEATFLASIQSGYYLEDFNSYSYGSYNSLSPLVLTSNDYTWSMASTTAGLYSSPGSMSVGSYGYPINISFSGNPVTAVGAIIGPSDYLGNFVAGNINLTLSDGTSLTNYYMNIGDFLGFTSATPITSMSINTPLGDDTCIQIDHFYVGAAAPVPIPAAVWLLGSGLIGLIGVRRFKK
jgi:hypothetical protein